MGPSSSELRRDSRSVCLRLLSQVAWRFTVWFNLEMIQKLVLKLRFERSSILMKSHLDVSVPVIMVLDFESGLRLVRRLIVNRSVEGRGRDIRLPWPSLRTKWSNVRKAVASQSRFLWPSLRAAAKQSRTKYIPYLNSYWIATFVLLTRDGKPSLRTKWNNVRKAVASQSRIL